MELKKPRTAREVVDAILVGLPERAKLLAFARSRYGICASDAEDILQETALDLLRQRSYVQNPEAFVFAVFRARCGRFVRSQQARRQAFSGGAVPIEEVASPMGAEYFDQRLALRKALDSVSASCRRLLCAHFVEGQSLRESAKRLSLAYSSVSKTISRCLRKLRECLS